ncbi:MAG: endolytic transglycosylase MltG [Gammaproteobacteria bacterium]
MRLRILKFVAVLMVVVTSCVALGTYYMWQEMQVALAKPNLMHEPVLFEISRGTSVRQLARSVAENGWIADPWFFEIEARRRKISHRLKAGTYEIKPGDTANVLLERFIAGDTVNFSVSFIEGMTLSQILTVLAAAPHIQHTLQDESEEALAAMIAPQYTSLEGWIFPSTYRYSVGSTDLELLERAHQKMQAVVARHWQAKKEDLPYVSPYEALIMASIIEKETGQAAERKQIAGVFVRRLQKGMKLQTDPTVIYGIKESFDGNLRRKDLRTDTPYNTYTRHGLPPTPIAMPGEAAIEAALQPADGDALYFVAKGDGWHAFSASLEKHNAAVRKYQLKK